MIADLVLGEHDEMVAAAVLLVLVDEAAAFGVRVGLARHVRLATENRLEDFLFQRSDFLLAFRDFRLVGQLRKLLLQRLDLVLHFAVLLGHGVGEFFDAVHHPVVGDGHGVHAIRQALVNQRGNGRHPVENGILRMHMQVRELAHSIFFLIVSFIIYPSPSTHNLLTLNP